MELIGLTAPWSGSYCVSEWLQLGISTPLTCDSYQAQLAITYLDSHIVLVHGISTWFASSSSIVCTLSFPEIKPSKKIRIQ